MAGIEFPLHNAPAAAVFLSLVSAFSGNQFIGVALLLPFPEGVRKLSGVQDFTQLTDTK